MAGMKKPRNMRDMQRWLENMKTLRTREQADKLAAPALKTVRLPQIAAPKLPKPAISTVRNEKSANMFYTKPENRGTIVKSVTPVTTARQAAGMKPAANVKTTPGAKPAATTKPRSIAEFQKEIAVMFST